MRVAVLMSMLCAGSTLRSQPPARDYLVLVASESVDRVALVRFGPAGARVEREKYVGWSKMEVAGPHGVAITPNATEYFVTIAHGTPFGKLVKYDAATDTQLGSVMLGNFPATAQVSPDGALVFVVNFNLHGEMETSDVSVVAAKEMVEIARIRTCTMPHGSRLSSDGTKHYSACMMDETLVEIDASTLSVSRHFFLTKGKEMGMTGAPPARGASEHAGHDGTATDMSGHGMEPPKPGDISCSPTWAQPSRDGSRVWVACNKSSDLVEIDTKSWTLVRRLPAAQACTTWPRRTTARGSSRPTSVMPRCRCSTPCQARNSRAFLPRARWCTASRLATTTGTHSSRWKAWARSRARWM